MMESSIGVAMRIPGLFLLEYWYRYRYKSLPNSLEVDDIANCVATNLVLLHGFLLLLLPLQYVRALYTHFISGFILLSCQVVSKEYINLEISKVENLGEDSFFLKRQILMLIFHGCFGLFANYLLKGPSLTYIPLASIYAIPVFARLSNLPIDTLPILQNVCNALTCCCIFLYLTYQIPKIVLCAKLVYTDAVIVTEVHGLARLLMILWNKLFVPTHFALFWLIEFVLNLAAMMYQKDKLPWGNEWYVVLLTVVSSICSSPIMLVATAVSVSYLSYLVLCSTRFYLQGSAAIIHDNPAHSGWNEGFTLLWLSFQTGMIELKVPARILVMTIVLFIVLSFLMTSMLEIVEPVLLGLSASGNRNKWKHFRALSMCIGLFVFPLYLTKVLSSIFPIDFWMMVVLSSICLTSVAVLDLLIVHSLFLYDSVRPDTWENLDDIVYYTRAITKVLEFFGAIFVVGMGLWRLWSDSGTGSWVSAFSLLAHCYFNVVLRLQTGWKSFLLRREASKKAKSLPSANTEQLAELDDVCSICFASMASACITPCQHYFHRTCLRKWLYVQDKCPLCHSMVTLPTISENQENTPQNN